MLLLLSIKNVALIRHAELEFSKGLNVLSGETGAGKSVILDCIDFVLGAKADKDMVRHGESECSVRAEFSCESETVRAILSDMDIEPEDILVISRKLTAEGKGAIRVNGCSVTLSMLRRLTSVLIDVHGQSEHFFLLKESNQLKLLDSIAGEKVLAVKTELYGRLSERSATLEELRRLGGDEGERARRSDILSYQIDELELAALQEKEEDELISLRDRLRNLEKILQGLNTARDRLTAEAGSLDGIYDAAHALHPLRKFGENYGELADRLDSIASELDDVVRDLETEIAGLDADDGEAERAEERLDVIRTLKKKYGGTVRAALEYLERAKEEYELLVNGEARRKELEAILAGQQKEVFRCCVALTAARKEAAAAFTRRVTDELKTLNITSAKFEISFGEYSPGDVERANSDGLDSIVFLFSANAGEPLKPLGKIISGGEMSRFMLAVKAQLSHVEEIGTYLFDEIDAGIGGKTARVVAEKFFAISKDIQIIAVSHLAQIASFADREFLIEKREGEGRTFTVIQPLEGEDRLKEIARLIGGDTGETALRHARELLESAQTYKISHAENE